MRPSFSSSCCLSLACLVCALLTGCTMGTTGAPTPEAGPAIQGRVMGGQQPLVGAQVYLFTPNTTGYGGAGIAASAINASVSLLTSGSGRTLDTSGGPTNGDYYVTTGTGGAFGITGDYTCTANTPVYLYALGGDAGSGTNASSGLLALLGNCPGGGAFSSSLFVVMNEVSTIVTAYAMAGFATDALHVSSSGTALAKAGIGSVYNNVQNLETLSTGIPTSFGPQSEINTLANILASCVNSNGAVTGPASPTACYTLFNNAESGGSSGTIPSDTATAAINIAHNPGTNITALYALPVASPPFVPALSAQPNDFTIGLYGGPVALDASIAVDASDDLFFGYGFTLSNSAIYGLFDYGNSSDNGYAGGGDLFEPVGLAVDTSGNVWAANYGNSSVTRLSNSGSILANYTGGGLSALKGVAVDGSGNVWFPDGSAITEISSSGSFVSGTNGYTSIGGQWVAIDGAGDAWVTVVPNSVARLSSSGSLLFNVALGGGPTGIAVDSAGNAWTSDFNNSLSKINNAGTVTTYTGGGLNQPQGVVIDGGGNVWVANGGGNSVSEFSSAGTAITGTGGYSVPPQASPAAIAIDGSGDVWIVNNGSYAELVGAATPVITPIAAGLPSTPTVNGTSNLGTRP